MIKHKSYHISKNYLNAGFSGKIWNNIHEKVFKQIFFEYISRSSLQKFKLINNEIYIMNLRNNIINMLDSQDITYDKA